MDAGKRSLLDPLPLSLETVSSSQAEGERQSGSKALECGFFRLWEMVDRIKLNVFMPMVRLNANG